MYYIEIRAWTARVGPPFFISLDDTTQYLGFRSVYCYPEHVKNIIQETGTSSDLQWAEVYSDTLFLDFDNTDPSELLLFLYDNGYAHSVWDSGNRSVHVHVPIEPMVGSTVPHSQRVWVKTNVPNADPSFYTHAGQFRLPNTRHLKTGRKKLLRHKLLGKRLHIPTLDTKPQGNVYAANPAQGSILYGALMCSKNEGGRRVYVWHLATLAYHDGLSIDQTINLISWWNERRCDPPLTIKKIEEKVFEVYKKNK